METPWLLQFGATLRRTFLIKIRDASQTFQEIFLPVYIVALLILVKLLQPETVIPVTPWQPKVDALCRPVMSDSHSVCQHLMKRNPSETMLAYVSRGNLLIDTFIHQVSQQFVDEYDTPKLVAKSFRTEDDLVNYYISHPETVYAAVIFEGVENSNTFPTVLNYRIRINGSYIPSAQEKIASKEDCRPGAFKCGANNYLASGFLALQSIISQVTLKMAVTNSSCSQRNFTRSIFARQQPLPSYHLSFASRMFQFFTSMYMVWALVPQLQTVLHHIVKEKEDLIKDCMLIMGLRESVYWISWFVTYASMSAFTSAILVLMVKFSSLFAASDTKLLFLVFYSFSLSLISLAFALSTIFSKVRTAITVSGALMILGSLVIIPVEFLQWTSTTCLLLSLFSPVGLAIAVNITVALEGSGKGLTTGSIWSTSTGIDQVDGNNHSSVGIIICIMVFDCVCYLLIAWYLDNIWPHPERGSKKPWNFIFSKRFCPNNKQHLSVSEDVVSFSRSPNLESAISSFDLSEGANKDSGNNPAKVEGVDPAFASKVAVEIENLRKVYVTPRKWCGIWSFDHGIHSKATAQKEIEAIKGLTLKIYESERFAIIGHSGCGKSSLIHIISTLSRSTSGDVYIYGHSISAEDAELKSVVSICPKGNICSGFLSPREELEYFSTIKGKPWGLTSYEGSHVSAKAQIDEFLQELNLLGDADKQANYLTPHARRKLSLALALVGDPKIVLLDQPTDGLDINSKRQFWNLISKIQKKFVLIFTTDSMEEADSMADRKALLSHGVLKCCGSSIFLRKCFGLHYLLHVTKEDNFNLEKVVKLIQSHIADAVLLPTPRGQQHSSFKIPLESSSQIHLLLMELTLKAAELGIQGVDLEATTLEEIFMKFQDECEDEASSFEHLSGEPLVEDAETELEALLGDKSSSTVDSERGLITMQISALLLTRLRLYWRNLSSTLATISLPMVLTFLVLCAQLFLGKSSPKSVILFDASIGHKIPIYYTIANQTASFNAQSILDILGTNHVLLDEASLFKRLDVSQQQPPNHAPAIGISFDEIDIPSCIFKYTIDYHPWHVHQLPTVTAMLDNAFQEFIQINHTKGSIVKMQSTSQPLPYGEADIGTSLMVVFFFTMGILLLPPILASQVVFDKQSGLLGLFRSSGMRSLPYWLGCYVTDIMLLCMSSVITLCINALFEYSPFTKETIPVIMLLLVAILPAILLLSYVLSFLIDNAQSAVSSLSIIFVLIAAVPYFVIFIPSGQISYFGWHILITVIDPPYTLLSSMHLVVASLDLLRGENGFIPSSIKSTLYFLKWNKHIILSVSCTVLSTILLLASLWQWESYNLNPEPKDMHTYSIGEVPIEEEENSDITQEREKVQSSLASWISNNPEQDFEESNIDPVICFRMGKQLKASTNPCMPTREQETWALQDIWLAVEHGETLVLLGGEKAGKSTLLKCLAKQTKITSGDALLCGNSVRHSLWNQNRIIGYCPQNDLMYQSLTPREYLKFIASLKGLSNPEMTIGVLLDTLQLTEDADKRIKSCKQSSQRKIAFATAILGDPAVMLLDEPTYGLDTLSRQRVWRWISRSTRTEATLICTQSFEEAEALGKRVGILVNGRLKCLSSQQELKRRYGSEYLLLVIAEKDKMDPLTEFISSLLPSSHNEIDQSAFNSTETRNLAQKRFQVPIKKLSELAVLLRELEVSRDIFGIKDYVISQPTLQKVFYRISQLHAAN